MTPHTILFLIRLFRKDKSYYMVSVLGLALSLASFIVITLFVKDELSYDKLHVKSERIYRATLHLRLNDVDYDEAPVQFPAAHVFQTEFPEVEEALRIYPQPVTLRLNEKEFDEPRSIFVDANFFKVFSFPLIAGDPNTVLKVPASVVLTTSTAARYFGHENPIGKELILDGQTLIVTGVAADVPDQSHLKFDILIPLEYQLAAWKNQTGLEGRENKWFWNGAYTYLLLHDGMDANKVRSKLPALVTKYFPERYKENDGRLELQPLTAIHLKSNLAAELEPGGSYLYLKLFIVVGIVIMTVSTINLINLAYYKISTRVKELGIRKFLGQNSLKIGVQLVLESTLTGALSFLVALVMVILFLPEFNLLVQKNILLWSNENILILGASLAFVMVVCAGSVIRPAFRYAARPSRQLLLVEYKNPGTRNPVRNFLIGMQVCFSFVLLVFTFIIGGQTKFINNKDLGFDKQDVIALELPEPIIKDIESFKNELKSSKDIVGITGVEISPGLGYNAYRFVPEGGSYESPLMLPFSFCDFDFIGTMRIKLVDGVNFDPANTYDSFPPILINQQALRELGWQGDAIGKRLEVFAPGTTEIMAKGKVIGVIQDYHFESLHSPVKPVVLTLGRFPETALIRTSGLERARTIQFIEQAWKKFSDKPFEYEFLDVQLDKLYTNEKQLANMILFFTLIALYLTCHGLFAMSSLFFTSRLKEVSIRKVFGASRWAIVKQLYFNYALFELIAILIGCPAAFYVGNLWLNNFQYRIDLSALFFIKAVIAILMVGFLSVGYYLAKVVISNPIRFLRNE